MADANAVPSGDPASFRLVRLAKRCPALVEYAASDVGHTAQDYLNWLKRYGAKGARSEKSIAMVEV